MNNKRHLLFIIVLALVAVSAKSAGLSLADPFQAGTRGNRGGKQPLPIMSPPRAAQKSQICWIRVGAKICGQTHTPPI